MISMPTKLCRAEAHSYGCVLVLADGRSIRLEVGYDDLNAYFTEQGFSSLQAVARTASADVYCLPLQMTITEWQLISDILTKSEVAQGCLAGFPVLSNRLHLTFGVIKTLAYRVYGGIGEPVAGVTPTFYLSHPIDFTLPAERDDSWRYALLSHRGGHLFKTHVNIRTSAVEIEHCVIENHFVERRSDLTQDGYTTIP